MCICLVSCSLLVPSGHVLSQSRDFQSISSHYAHELTPVSCAGNGTVQGFDMLDLQSCTARDGDLVVEPVVFPHISPGLTIAGLLSQLLTPHISVEE